MPNLHVNTVHNWHQKRNTYVYVNLVLLKTYSSWDKVYKPTNIYQEIDGAERPRCSLYEARDDLLFHDVTDDTVDILWGQPDLGTLGEDLVEAVLVDVNESQFGAPSSHLLRRATADLTTSTYENKYIFVIITLTMYCDTTGSSKAVFSFASSPYAEILTPGFDFSNSTYEIKHITWSIVTCTRLFQWQYDIVSKSLLNV